jgi:hypothetical protein
MLGDEERESERQPDRQTDRQTRMFGDADMPDGIYQSMLGDARLWIGSLEENPLFSWHEPQRKRLIIFVY